MAPTYFRPLFESIVGWLLLGIFAIIVSLGYGLLELAIRWWRTGRVVLGVVILVGYLLSWLVALWIVMLGPAALILMKPAS